MLTLTFHDSYYVVSHILNGVWFLGIMFENRGLQQKEFYDFINIFNGKLVLVNT